MATNKCIALAAKAVENRLSEKEIEEMLKKEVGVNDVDNLLPDVLERVKKANDNIKLASSLDKYRMIRRIQKKKYLLNQTDITAKNHIEPTLGLLGTIVGTTRAFPGSNYSAHSIKNALFAKYMRGFQQDLEKAGPKVMVAFRSRQISREIAQELWELSIPNGKSGKTGNPEAQQIAVIIDKWYTKTIYDANREGALIRKVRGFAGPQKWDLRKIDKLGVESFKDTMEGLLDKPRILREHADGGEPIKNWDKWLEEVYNNIVSGDHDHAALQISDVDFRFKGGRNEGKRLSAHRKLHFKDSDSYMDAMKLMGRGDFEDNLTSHFDHMSRSTALMTMFGDNPQAMFDDIMSTIKSRHKGGKESASIRKNTTTVLNAWKTATGETLIPSHIGRANFTAWANAIEQMAIMGNSAIASLSDLGMHSNELRVQGLPLLKNNWTAVENMLHGLGPREKKVVASMYGTALDAIMGDMHTRFSLDPAQPGQAAKLLRIYYNANLLAPLTEAHQTGLSAMMARNLGSYRELPFDKIPRGQQRLMIRYGMDEADWEHIRASAEEMPGLDWGHIVTPEHIENLPLERFGGSVFSAKEARTTLANKVRGYVLDRGSYATPQPGWREQSTLGQGTRPGDPAGVAIRLFALLKGFLVTVATKNLGDVLYAGGARNFKEAMIGTKAEDINGIIGGRADFLALANMMVYTTVLGALSLQLKEVAKGRTPRDMDDYGFWKQSVVQGGMYGLYGDLLLGEYHQYGRSMAESLAGPVMSDIFKGIEYASSVVAGEPNHKEILKTIVSKTPGANLFYTRWGMDYLILNRFHEWTNPGYLLRNEKRMREQGQEHLLTNDTTAF